MRVAEIMTDFRNIQTYIAAIRASPAAEDYNELGFALLRQCESEALALLNQPFRTTNGGGGGDDEEQQKMQLRRCVFQTSPLQQLGRI